MIVGVRPQLIGAVGGRVEDHAAGPPHDLLQQRYVSVDSLDRRLDQQGVMHRSAQAQPVSCRPDAGNAQDLRPSCLHRPVLQGATIELGDAGPAPPVQHRPHLAAVERGGQPIVGPSPVDGE